MTKFQFFSIFVLERERKRETADIKNGNSMEKFPSVQVIFFYREGKVREIIQKDCIHFLQRYGFVDLVQASNLGPTNLSC